MVGLLSISSNFVLAQPPNDNLADAIEITTIPYTSPGVPDVEMDAATTETNENVCGSKLDPVGSWWYTFTTTVSGNLNFQAADFDANPSFFGAQLYMGIYTDATHPLTEEECSTTTVAALNSGTEIINFSVNAGTTYYVQVTNADQGSSFPTSESELRITGDDVFVPVPASIPTLSEWGLLILALLLMTAGTLYLMQPNFRKGLNRNS